MDLLRFVFREYARAFIGVLVLSLASAGLGVGVIAYINQRLIAGETPVSALPGLLGLLLALLAVSLGAQLALTTLGHHFVYRLRARLVKRILDTDIEHLETLGSARLLASLSSDVRNITIAFVRLPELVQGIVLTSVCAVYLAWLSPSLLAVTSVWIALTMAGGAWLVSRVYAHLRDVRESEDRLYRHFQTVIDGRKELALNRDRARRLYEGDYDDAARDYRHHVIRADTFHLSANNWTNIMMLGAIGVVFFLANGLGWADTAVAATFSLTLLFLRTPLIQAVGAWPTLTAARVAFEKLAGLTLADYEPGFPAPAPKPDWQELTLRGATYRYPTSGDKGFAVGPVDLTLNRGEQVFLIGGNGSGKSTLARLLAGLVAPHEGELQVDGRTVTAAERHAYRARFASVFTDFHLFDELLGPGGAAPEDTLVAAWTEHLGMTRTGALRDGRIASTRLSQGQRKRLALLLAIAESRDVLLLDEWAADQDPEFRQTFYREVLPRLRDMGKTVFAISHDDQYFRHADRLLEMRNGRLVELTGAQREEASRDAVARLQRGG